MAAQPFLDMQEKMEMITNGRFALLFVAVVVVGCSKTPEPKVEPAAAANVVQAPVIPVQAAPKPDDPLHQSFAKATTPEVPPKMLPPVDKLLNGKNSGKLYAAITGRDGAEGVWDQIRFVGSDGKPLKYNVTLQTDVGEIAIELWPDVAPNHVRNFLALCKVGYYDGMNFHETTRQDYKDEEDKDQVFEYIEAGCPLGTGAVNQGHIGYWLKPELHDPEANPKVRHDAGTVGAWRGYDLETAACKFYITLSKAPGLDGNYTVFGRVTRGLDVARKVLEKPATERAVIRSVVVHSGE